MAQPLSRREFILGFGVVAALLCDNVGAGAAGVSLLKDLSQPSRQPSGAPGSIRFGYASITWGGSDEQAIDDIASVGFRGIQLRSNILAKFGDRPAALRELLERRGLTMVALSSGNLGIDPAVEREQLEAHTRHAKFMRELWGAVPADH